MYTRQEYYGSPEGINTSRFRIFPFLFLDLSLRLSVYRRRREIYHLYPRCSSFSNISSRFSLLLKLLSNCFFFFISSNLLRSKFRYLNTSFARCEINKNWTFFGRSHWFNFKVLASGSIDQFLTVKNWVKNNKETCKMFTLVRPREKLNDILINIPIYQFLTQ